jgi:hypothetical protein
MADYPAKPTFRGRGQWEREAVRNGHPPEFSIGDRVQVFGVAGVFRITNLELRQCDPPVWRFEVRCRWYFASELRSK